MLHIFEVLQQPLNNKDILQPIDLVIQYFCDAIGKLLHELNFEYSNTTLPSFHDDFSQPTIYD